MINFKIKYYLNLNNIIYEKIYKWWFNTAKKVIKNKLKLIWLSKEIYTRKWTFRSHRTFFSTFRKYGKNEGTNQNSNLRMHTNAKVSTAYYGGTWGGARYYRVARLGMEARSGVQQLSTLVPDLRFTNLSLLASMKSPSRSFLWCQVVS